MATKGYVRRRPRTPLKKSPSRAPAASKMAKQYLKDTDISDVPAGKIPEGPLSHETLSDIAQVDANAQAALEDANKPHFRQQHKAHAEAISSPIHAFNWVDKASPDSLTRMKAKRQIKAAIREFDQMKIQEAMRNPPREI